jgi:hypothetical protein
MFFRFTLCRNYSTFNFFQADLGKNVILELKYSPKSFCTINVVPVLKELFWRTPLDSFHQASHV